MYFQALFCWDTQRLADANIKSNYHSSLDAQSIASKIRTMQSSFFISNEQPPIASGVAAVQIWLVLFVFFEIGKVWSREGADGAFAREDLKSWRQREKCQHIICQNTIHCLQGKGQRIYSQVWWKLRNLQSPTIRRALLWLFNSICADGHLFLRQNSKRDQTIFEELVLLQFKKSFPSILSFTLGKSKS